jgi:hypothetical protein
MVVVMVVIIIVVMVIAMVRVTLFSCSWYASVMRVTCHQKYYKCGNGGGYGDYDSDDGGYGLSMVYACFYLLCCRII